MEYSSAIVPRQTLFIVRSRPLIKGNAPLTMRKANLSDDDKHYLDIIRRQNRSIVHMCCGTYVGISDHYNISFISPLKAVNYFNNFTFSKSVFLNNREMLLANNFAFTRIYYNFPIAFRLNYHALRIHWNSTDAWPDKIFLSRNGPESSKK